MTRRLLPHPALSVLLVAVWMLLVNELTFGALFLALAFGVLVPLVTSRFWPDRPRIRFGPDAAAYVAIVLFDIIVANFQIAWIILTRRNRDLRSHWLVIPTELRSAEAITVLAGTISLTPGTVSSDISSDGRALLVHALDVADPVAEVARIKQRYETRLLKVFR
ncbi:MAG: Na+/H+ antiporter subunit E [Alphaproteobacteria bacterium]|jgi:multicomponent K+:H+ antiporter subunit E|nr:Na+/H+ antiporter subunit E [Alphaproteobacteria bacterium]MBU2040394.1 Na+/H+ antiporter subunit E [Alphaproteobacteria bacterium]MBU2126812.1 Na+/H+ antiporter subunit E [Alphaproteobacteria bacterium]MBU2208860.1 Na+/H+ antiporter subunit E [Alphaproteobacteria bacterium]